MSTTLTDEQISAGWRDECVTTNPYCVSLTSWTKAVRWAERTIHASLASKPDARMNAREAAEGWALIPREPTPDMERFICNCDTRNGAKVGEYPQWQDCYRAMVASSPQSPPVVEGAVGDKTPGSDWHLTLLMAPYHLNLVVGSDRQHLLAWGRDVWRAALSAHGVKQPEPADTARIDWIERKAAEGWTPNLVYDDDGHFAVSFEGFQPIPQGDGAGYAEPVTVGAFVEPGDWHPSVRAAIDAAMSKEQPIHEARPDDRKEQT